MRSLIVFQIKLLEKWMRQLKEASKNVHFISTHHHNLLSVTSVFDDYKFHHSSLAKPPIISRSCEEDESAKLFPNPLQISSSVAQTNRTFQVAKVAFYHPVSVPQLSLESRKSLKDLRKFSIHCLVVLSAFQQHTASCELCNKPWLCFAWRNFVWTLASLGVISRNLETIETRNPRHQKKIKIRKLNREKGRKSTKAGAN